MSYNAKCVAEDGLSLEFIKDQDKELCMEAVKQNGLALQFVLEKFKTSELCMAAIKQNGRSITFIPEDILTQEMCIIVLDNNELIFPRPFSLNSKLRDFLKKHSKKV